MDDASTVAWLGQKLVDVSDLAKEDSSLLTRALANGVLRPVGKAMQYYPQASVKVAKGLSAVADAVKDAKETYDVYGGNGKMSRKRRQGAGPLDSMAPDSKRFKEWTTAQRAHQVFADHWIHPIKQQAALAKRVDEFIKAYDDHVEASKPNFDDPPETMSIPSTVDVRDPEYSSFDYHPYANFIRMKHTKIVRRDEEGKDRHPARERDTYLMTRLPTKEDVRMDRYSYEYPHGRVEIADAYQPVMSFATRKKLIGKGRRSSKQKHAGPGK